MNTVNWIDTFFNNHKPLIVAGPCSVESPEQVRHAAIQLRQLGVPILRAGIWKPRTRPGFFEGKGDEALTWLQDVKKETGMWLATEVANPHHVEKACQAGIDIVWLGARTTVNPFVVQEIAAALRGTQRMVWVKNPISPDLSLWIGALERIYQAGIQHLGAIHRGFSSLRPSRFRNVPAWQIALELKSNYPHLPLIADPSHIAGNREGIFEVSQRALDLGYEGLMIEVHPDPDRALSDARQQITPAALGTLIGRLRVSQTSSRNVRFLSQLEKLREQIDHIDQELIETLASRMRIAEQIGWYKKENNVTVFQPERWKEIMQSRPEWGRQAQLATEFIRELYRLIHDESIRLQTRILNQKEAHEIRHPSS